MRKRRAFLINSTVLLLIIPLMLLLATYEDVSSQIIVAQSERTQVERTYRVVSYFELDFQKALELSGKRAVVAAVDYVAVTGSFISPAYRVNNTIRDLILTGTSSSMPGYDFDRVMKGQSIRKWLTNMSQELREQGFELSPSVDEIADNISITVAPLDSFRVVVKARIPNMTIRDLSGRTIYTGPIPRSGGYIYSIVNLENLEDSFFSAMTGGRYQRSIRACSYPFPELIDRPIKVLSGDGKSSEPHVPGELIKHLESDKIYFGDYYPGDGARAYVLMNGSVDQTDAPIIVNTTLNGIRISPLDVFNNNDMGVLVFDNVGGGTSGGWCSSLGYRLNLTIQNNVGIDLTDFQVPIVIDSTTFPDPTLTTFFNTADSDRDNIPVIEIYGKNCNPINFWIENWDTATKQALIWVNVTIPASSSITLGIYFDSSGTETLGSPEKVFDFYDDFNEGTLDTKKWEQYNAQVSFINGVLRITNDYAGIYTKKTFTPPVIIEFRQNIKNSWAELYIAVRQASYPWGPLWWVRRNHVQPAEWSYLDDHQYGRYHEEDLNLPRGWHKGTIYWFKYNSRLEWDTGAVVYNTYNTYQDYKGAIALGTWDKNQEWDWIRVRKYASIPPTVTMSNQIDTIPTSPTTYSNARAYEGSDENHEDYVALAHEMQDELNYKPPVGYYPIGLVSFMVPHANYDEKLFNLMRLLEIPLEEGQSSVDYYFLKYYFGGGSKVDGYRVWGISQGDYYNIDLGTSVYLSRIPFFLDVDTAKVILGTQGACQLLDGYTCP
ncbi:MAG: hypothetical protein PWQ95_1035 [Thermococcaceae archaeon]|nr:hypothetical protein [Thermococcaceae archaeon]